MKHFTMILLVTTCITLGEQARHYPPMCFEQQPLSQLHAFFSLVHDIYMGMDQHWFIEQANLPPNTAICHGLSKPEFAEEPQKWQEVADRKLKVFSAFFEHREKAGGPAVRVVGTGFQEQFHAIGDLYCQLWYDDRKYPVVVGPAVYDRIYPSIGHPDMWVSHFVLCKLPEATSLPYGVSVVPSKCAKPVNQLLVLNRDRVVKTDTHALCISPMYNNFKEWEMVIEWIEIHKLLGAKEITLYKFWISHDTNKVLESYLKDNNDNTVNVINWPYPPLKSNVWCQRGALNDCLYRMGHRHKYVTITDMDEILVPRMQGEDWSQLVKRLHAQDAEVGAFLFQHAYFRRNTSLEKPHLITQSSFWRPQEVSPPGKIRCKAMYEADKAVKIDLHFPYKLVEGAKELILDPNDGMLHHYRPYPMETFVKNPDKFTFIEDNHLEMFKERLVKATAERHRKIKQL